MASATILLILASCSSAAQAANWASPQQGREQPRDEQQWPTAAMMVDAQGRVQASAVADSFGGDEYEEPPDSDARSMVRSEPQLDSVSADAEEYAYAHDAPEAEESVLEQAPGGYQGRPQQVVGQQRRPPAGYPPRPRQGRMQGGGMVAPKKKKECLVPMWTKDDYVCTNHEQASRSWTDGDKVKRKFMEDGDSCEVTCPAADGYLASWFQWWREPDVPTMACDNAKWVLEKGGEVKGINCGTSKVAYLFMYTAAIGIAVGGYYYNERRKKQQLSLATLGGGTPGGGAPFGEPAVATLPGNSRDEAMAQFDNSQRQPAPTGKAAADF